MDGLQESSVQGLLSSQLMAEPAPQTPLEQVSPVVQALPSSHDPETFAWTHPMLVSQESLVQTLLSLQEAVMSVWTHPVEVLHESLVQALLSSQLVAPPPTQLPPLQASPVVQALPSLQAAVLSVGPQEPAPSHRSSVQTLPSLVHAEPEAWWFD